MAESHILIECCNSKYCARAN